MSQAVPAINAPTLTRPWSWWVFCAWRPNKDVGSFIYGCAAKCFRPSGWSFRQEVHIGDGTLITSQITATDAAFRGFETDLAAGTIRPALMLGESVPEASVAAKRVVVQWALGHTAAKSEMYYSLPSRQDIVGDNDANLERVLSALEHELGLPFKTSYAVHLGNFEIFGLHPWLDQPPPFVIERTSVPDLGGEGPETWEIARTPAFANARHTAHFTGLAAGDVVVDRLIFLPAGEHRTSVVAPEPLDQFRFRLFDASGETLLHSEEHSLLRQISLTMSPISQQVKIDDDLARRAAQKGVALESSAALVHAHTSHRSLVGAPTCGSWREWAGEMEHWAAAYMPPPSEDRWFRRGIEGEVGATAHFNHLISGAQVKGAILVDPYFGTDALSRFVVRLGSRDVYLTIVTSWTTVDPDSGLLLPPDQLRTQRLEEALNKLRPFINPQLAVINVVDGQEQAFHDRYLLLYPHEGAVKVFLLSNSLNKAAGKWPFAMSLLARDVGREVQRYIEALLRGRDIAREKDLTVTFRWPTDEV